MTITIRRVDENHWEMLFWDSKYPNVILNRQTVIWEDLVFFRNHICQEENRMMLDSDAVLQEGSLILPSPFLNACPKCYRGGIDMTKDPITCECGWSITRAELRQNLEKMDFKQPDEQWTQRDSDWGGYPPAPEDEADAEKDLKDEGT